MVFFPNLPSMLATVARYSSRSLVTAFENDSISLLSFFLSLAGERYHSISHVEMKERRREIKGEEAAGGQTWNKERGIVLVSLRRN
jgi:hypothetical protein